MKKFKDKYKDKLKEIDSLDCGEVPLKKAILAVLLRIEEKMK